MLKKSIIYSASTCLIFMMTSCGPAAEEKSLMMSNAKRIADSIANLIQTSMNSAAEGPRIITMPPAATPSATAPSTTGSITAPTNTPGKNC